MTTLKIKMTIECKCFLVVETLSQNCIQLMSFSFLPVQVLLYELCILKSFVTHYENVVIILAVMD